MTLQTHHCELIGKCIWPAFALLLLVMFYNPAKNVFDRIASGGAERVSVGQVTIQFTTDRVPAVADIEASTLEKFAQLSADDREVLLAVGQYSPPEDACTVEGFESALRAGTAETNDFFARRVQNIIPYRTYLGSLHRLEALNFLRSSSRQLRPDEPYCIAGQGLMFRLTDEGRKARRYYLDLTNQTIAFSNERISPE